MHNQHNMIQIHPAVASVQDNNEWMNCFHKEEMEETTNEIKECICNGVLLFPSMYTLLKDVDHILFNHQTTIRESKGRKDDDDQDNKLSQWR